MSLEGSGDPLPGSFRQNQASEWLGGRRYRPTSPDEKENKSLNLRNIGAGYGGENPGGAEQWKSLGRELQAIRQEVRLGCNSQLDLRGIQRELDHRVVQASQATTR